MLGHQTKQGCSSAVSDTLCIPGDRALLRDFIRNLPPQRLLRQKLQSLTDIVNSKVFQSYGE